MQAVEKTCGGCGARFASGEVFCPVDGLRLRAKGELAKPPTDPLIGMLLDERYRVLRAIGEGGMGVVYEAEHVVIEKRVALKVLRDDFSGRPDVVARFRQEARSASKIGHRHIVDVSDFGETPSGASYFVMEMLRGEDLADVLARDAALSPMRAVGILHQCARALAAAHAKGIVHRDLKPENVFLTHRDGQPDFVKVVDFGVAKMSDLDALGVASGRRLTKTGMLFGTPEYMSPEQALGHALDHRVDIYALGVLLFELITGRVPFEGDNFMEVLSKHANHSLPTLTAVNAGVRVSSELQTVIERALTKDREARFQSMNELAVALERTPEMPAALLRESSVPPEWSLVPPPSLPARPSREPIAAEAAPKPRVPWAYLFAGATALLVAGASPWLWQSATTTERRMRELPVAVVAPAVAQDVQFTDGAQPTAFTAGAASHAAALAPAVEPRVKVRVTTRPSGASVRLAGRGDVCASTPCEFDAQRGEALSIEARRGRMAASAELMAADSTELHLILDAPANKAAFKRAPTVSSDLKVPAAFR